MKTDSEIEAMHQPIRVRYPNGLSYDEFKIETLQTADEEGRVYPLPLANMGTFQFVTRMSMIDKVLDYRGTHHTPLIPNHFINDNGREFLRSLRSPQ